MKHVSKKAIWMWVLGYLTGWASVSVFIFWFVLGNLWLYFGPQPSWGPIWDYAILATKWSFFGLSAVLVLMIFSAISNSFYRYWSLGYSMEASDLKIVKGIIIKHENYIPYRNIDSVDIRVSAAQRLMGLASILVFTPGAHDKENPDAAEGYLEGLKYEDAIALKDELLKKSNPAERLSQPSQMVPPIQPESLSQPVLPVQPEQPEQSEHISPLVSVQPIQPEQPEEPEQPEQ